MTGFFGRDGANEKCCTTFTGALIGV